MEVERLGVLFLAGAFFATLLRVAAPFFADAERFFAAVFRVAAPFFAELERFFAATLLAPGRASQDGLGLLQPPGSVQNSAEN